jgi:glutaredoxin
MFKIYGSNDCRYCRLAKTLLEDRDMPFEYIMLSDTNIEEQSKLMSIAGVAFQTIPQIFVELDNGIRYVGGYAELKRQVGG